MTLNLRAWEMRWVPQVAVLRDLCRCGEAKTQVCEYADLWHP